VAEIAQRRPRPRDHLLALALAAGGGALGILAAGFEEVRSGGFILLPFVVAPMAEEALKPIGVYVLLYRWPHILRGRLYTATLTALSGLSFGAIESAIYVTVYNPGASREFFIYRFSVTLVLHMVASFIAGLGISPRLLAWANRGGSFPRDARYAYAIAIALHSAYNITAVTLSLTGVLDF
jgi:hypothetical protein